MISDKVSVIMPVYNTPLEKFEVSVNSVLKQTYINLELIIIDDGSDQNCAASCDELAAKDCRIIVVHQENTGVSGARNKGTDLASGSYVIYVDSDDIIDPFAIQEGIKVITETNASFVFAAIEHISDYSEFIFPGEYVQHKTHLYQKNEIDKVRSAFLTQRDKDFININGTGFVNRGPYARLIQKDVASKVRFNEKLRIGEDVEWNMRLLNASSSVCFVEAIWYGYLIYQSSTLRKYYGNRAQMLEEYHSALYMANQSFCHSHMNDYVDNVVVSFYSMVLYEFLAEQNPLTEHEKRIEIKRLLKRSPWNLMLNNKYTATIPTRYKIFLMACRCGCGLTVLRLWEGLKTWKTRYK